MKKTQKITNNRHPDDVRSEREGKAYAKAAIDAWFEQNREKLKRTIATYADGDAEDLWWSLREEFWIASADYKPTTGERKL